VHCAALKISLCGPFNDLWKTKELKELYTKNIRQLTKENKLFKKPYYYYLPWYHFCQKNKILVKYLHEIVELNSAD